jgi:hypothetical protein
MGKIINNFLLSIILFIAFPSNAYSLNLVNAEISHHDQSVKPVKPVKAVKSKKKNIKGPKQRRNQYDDYWISWVLYCFGILAFAGITSFIIGLFLASFPLWIMGLIVFSAINLFLYIMSYLIFFCVNCFEKLQPEDMGIIGLGIFILSIDFINLILAIAFIILGLNFAIPVFWIFGLTILGFLALSIILFFILDKLSW